jgi:Tfp pilus assembly protein PilE
MRRPAFRKRQSGLTLVEVLIASVLLMVVLVPAIEALHTGMLGNDVLQSTSSEHYAVLSEMEEVLAEPYGSLLGAAAAAGNETTPSSYSDAAGPPGRRLVYVALYDASDADGDNNFFTVLDADLDGDNDPYTGYDDLLWVRVEIDGSITYLESLVAL